MRRLLVPALVAAVAAVVVPTGSAQASAALTGPATAALGSAKIAEEAPPQTLTFTASGAVTITNIDDITQDGIDPDSDDPDFWVDDAASSCSDATLAAADTCTVVVRFLPFHRGSLTGHLTIHDTTGTTSVTLSGTGAPNPKGTYFRSPAKRLLDTRYVGSRQPMGAKSVRTVQITGANGVPASAVTAVVVNLTATKSTASSFLTVYPNGKPRPNASAMTFPKGFTGSNLVTVPVGSDGRIAIYNNAGSAHVMVDLVGYYVSAGTKGSDYSTLEPERVYDSRKDSVYANGDYLPVEDLFGDDPTIRAYAVNLTAVNPTTGGYFTAMNTDPNKVPSTATVTYSAGQTVANMAVVPVNGGGDFFVRNTQAPGGRVHMLLDVVGLYYDDPDFPVGLRYRPITPKRILDSRNKVGLSGPFGSGQTRNLSVPATVATDFTYGLVSNVTAVAPTVNTYLTLWGTGFDRPGVSNLNLNAKKTRANAAVPEVGDGNRVSIFNRIGSVNVILDVTGAFDFPIVLQPDSARQLPAQKKMAQKKMAQKKMAERKLARSSGGLHRVHAAR